MYNSREVVVSMRKDKLLKPTTKGHSWHCQIPTDANGKRKGVITHMHLLPGITDKATRVQDAVLKINATVKPSLLARLRECGEDSWVMVESEIRDQQAGKKHGYCDFTPYAINPEDGTVSYCQNLVMCEKVRSCTSERVHLAIKVTFVTCQRKDYSLRENEELGFCEVHHRAA